MTASQTAPYSFTAVQAGVDWITCTARGKDAQRALQAQTGAILETEAGAGVDITSARLRDYVGWRAPGVYIGSRRTDDICVLSSSHAARLWSNVAQAATNVSRLDLQVTVWTHGEQPALSRWYYQRMKRLPPQRGRPRSLSLIQTHPQGDTLYVGKRQSDCFGRVYDFASAHSQGPPRTLWRYEVEYKRHLASHHANSLLDKRVHASAVEQTVAGWYHARGIGRSWSSFEAPGHQDVFKDEAARDVLLWFRTSLSKTVGKAVQRYGVAAVLDALNLSPYVIERDRKEINAYANHAPQALHGDNRRGDREPTDDEQVLARGGNLFARFDGGCRD